MYRVSEFKIKGARTGSQLRGRENEYVYRIYWHGKDIGKQFVQKKAAQAFVSRFVKQANELYKRYEEAHNV